MRTLYQVCRSQTYLGPEPYGVPRKSLEKALVDLRLAPKGYRLIAYTILTAKDIRALENGTSHLLHSQADSTENEDE